MMTPATRRPRVSASCGTVLLLAALGLGGCLWFLLTDVWPAMVFSAREREIYPRFVQLNEDSLAKLPPPPGVEATQRVDLGYHGHSLWVDYPKGANTNTDIITYYDRLLPGPEWTNTGHSSGSIRYMRDTTCVTLYFFRSEYAIAIEHDFFRQSFSPPYPPPRLIQLFEMGEAYYPECPPR